MGKKNLFIKNGHDYIKLDIDDIIFIKSEADYTEIHTLEKFYLTSRPLKFWVEKLKNFNFTQTHRSYAINADKILKISGNRVFFEKTISLPIGRTYKENFVKKYLNWYFLLWNQLTDIIPNISPVIFQLVWSWYFWRKFPHPLPAIVSFLWSTEFLSHRNQFVKNYTTPCFLSIDNMNRRTP